MSQDYLHACQRAELLGLPVPSEEEWKETQRAQGEEQQANDENDEAVIQNLEGEDEAAKRVGGGLDELNSILNATQKKINRFKTVCGSLGTLLKVKVGTRNNTNDQRPAEKNRDETKDAQQDEPAEEEPKSPEAEVPDAEQNETKPTEGNSVTPKKIDMNEKMGSHLDKLDSLITKAENAQYSMQHQTKQMKKFLK